MSSSLEYNSTDVSSEELEEAPIKEQSSQLNLEHSSKSESELEEGSLDSVVEGSFYTHFPTLLNFLKPYFLKRNFRGPAEVLKYINERFHIDKIHNDLRVFPDLATDYIYWYTYVNSHLFAPLQQKIHQKITERTAHQQQYQYDLSLHYSKA